MRINLFLLFLLFIAQAVAVFAQDEKPACAQPFSFVFDEFSVKDAADTNSKLAALLERLAKEDPIQARAQIAVYAGRNTRIGEAESLISGVKSFLAKEQNIGDKVFVLDGGYRDTATIELQIKPLYCSTYATTRSGYGVDDIELEEAPKESTPVKTQFELESALKERVDPVCPPAAYAVRHCPGEVVVRVLIDEKGSVIFARSVSGLALLRSAGAAMVKQFKFKPFTLNGKPTKVFGNFTIQYTEPAYKIVDN